MTKSTTTMTTLREEDDLTTMESQRQAGSLRALHHTSEATINSNVYSWGGRRWDRGTILGGWDDRKGSRWRRFGGDIRAPRNHFQNYLLPTPEQQKDGNLFRMHPGSEAALLAPWSACVQGPMIGRIEKRSPKYFHMRSMYLGIFGNSNISVDPVGRLLM